MFDWVQNMHLIINKDTSRKQPPSIEHFAEVRQMANRFHANNLRRHGLLERKRNFRDSREITHKSLKSVYFQKRSLSKKISLTNSPILLRVTES